MERWQGLLLAGCLLASGPCRTGNAGETVSALWDPPAGEVIEIDRAVILVEDVFKTLQARHVDRPSRSDLIAVWSSAANPVLQSIPDGNYGPLRWTTLFQVFSGKATVEPPVVAKVIPEQMTVREQMERIWRASSGKEFEPRARHLMTQFLSQTAGSPALFRAAEARVERQLAANAYVGLGVTAMSSNDAYLKFPTILPGGAADRAGLTNEVVVLTIDGWNTQHQSITDAVERIRGPVGTVVNLRVRDQAGERDISIRRDFVKFQTVHGWPRGSRRTNRETLDLGPPLPSLPGEFAYVRCSQLSASTVQELHEAELRARQSGRTALILDLREPERNSDVKYTRRIADALLDDILLWREQDREGRLTDIRSDRDCLFRNFPMAVMIASDSPTPQKLLAATLQDTGRAIVIEISKGTSHELERLARTAHTGPPSSTAIYRLESCSLADGRWSLAVPTARFLRANGEANWAIPPNFRWQEPVPEIAGIESSLRTPSAVGVNTITEKSPLAVSNPALPESLQAFGPVGLAIAELRAAILASGNK